MKIENRSKIPKEFFRGPKDLDPMGLSRFFEKNRKKTPFGNEEKIAPKFFLKIKKFQKN